jgi:hypothetical protein
MKVKIIANKRFGEPHYDKAIGQTFEVVKKGANKMVKIEYPSVSDVIELSEYSWWYKDEYEEVSDEKSA